MRDILQHEQIYFNISHTKGFQECAVWIELRSGLFRKRTDLLRFWSSQHTLGRCFILSILLLHKACIGQTAIRANAE